MKLNWTRIWAVILRHLYNFRRSYDRMVDAFYWPALDIIVWGLTIAALQRMGQTTPVQIVAIIVSLILWAMIWRAQGDIGINLLEELWSENTVNLFATPLTVMEWVVSLCLLGLFKVVLTISFISTIAFALYAVNIFSLGWVFIPFTLILLLTGWAFGIFLAGLFVRFGTNIQTLAWAGAFMLMPFSAVTYPLATLPIWVQRVAVWLPTTYIFEGMRDLLINNRLNATSLVISLGLACGYLALAILFFAASFKKAMKQGLAHIK